MSLKKLMGNIRMRFLNAFVSTLAFLFNANPANVAKARNLIANTQGKISIGAIIGLVLGITVAAYLLPDAINVLMNRTYDAAVPAPVVTLLTTVSGIVIAVVFILMLYRQSKS